MTLIHDLLHREGFEGSYDAVRRYASRWMAARRNDVGGTIIGGAPAFISLLFQPGEAYQFDWSHEDVEIAGKPMRVKVAHMRLCASRAVQVRAYADRIVVRRGDAVVAEHPRHFGPRSSNHQCLDLSTWISSPRQSRR